MAWEPANYLVAGHFGPYSVPGYVYRGLGLHRSLEGSPKGRRPPTWTLTHLGSGHAVCRLKGTVAVVFPIGFQIAECSDWEFDGLDGWKNRDPQLPETVRKILSDHGIEWNPRGGSDHDIAQQIVIARAS
jgi:hypothetical protein